MAVQSANYGPNDQSGGNSTGVMGMFGSALGTNSNFQADPYQANQSDFGYGGPSQGTLGGYLANSQGQAANDYGQSQQAGAQQGSYLQSLQDAAAGNGPSTALGVLQQGTNAANAQAISLARSASGANPAAQAAALRNATMQGAANTTSAGAQAAQIKGNEQIAAMNAGLNEVNTQRGQDLQSMGQGNQMAGTYLGGQIQGGLAQQQGGQAFQQLQAADYNSAMGLNQATSAANAGANSQLLGAGAKAAGSLLASDARLKTNVTPAGSNTSAADSFLATLKPYTFRYKDPEDEPSSAPHGGSYLGVIAQNVEKGPTGQTLVTDTPHGKAIEQGASMGAALAGIGRLHERLSALEGMAARTKQSAGNANAA